MKVPPPKPGLRRGVSLVETMVSVGVLAVVAPLAIAALLRGGEGGSAARAETRAPVIVESCLQEIQVARDGNSTHLPALQAGQPFGDGEILCLAFRRDGVLLGPVAPASYEAGIVRVAEQDAAFLARLEGRLETERPGFPPLLKVAITLEHPAAAGSLKRRRLEFLTKLP
jgi:hypothetical protein